MKNHIAKNCIVLLVLVVFWGLLQAWRLERNPFKNYTHLKAKKGNYTFESIHQTDKKETTNKVFVISQQNIR